MAQFLESSSPFSMRYHRDGSRMTASLDAAEYTGPITPVASGGAQPVAMYGLGANSGENVHHLVETGQGNSWPMLRACADALPTISRDTSQFDTEARIAVVDEQLLHAPVPLSGQQPFFFSGTPNYAGYLELQQLQPQVAHETCVSSFQGYYVPQAPLTDVSSLGDLQYPQEATQTRPNDIAPYQEEAPTRTFPTPSELLVELASTNPNAHCNSSRNSSDLSRRRRRLVSRDLGVIPGDPPARESISSHEKKRQYLECLEYYVMFLQQQLSLVGAEPVLLERVPQYPGLNNRSIRTLLVHMQSTTERLNMRTLREEQRFLELRDAIYRQDAAGATVQTFQDQTIDNEESLNRSFFR